MSDEIEIIDPLSEKMAFAPNPPPPHTHSFSEITSLTAWQASIERSLANKNRDIELLKKAFLVLFIIVFFLAGFMMVFLG